jgi:hypothetical protein
MCGRFATTRVTSAEGYWQLGSLTTRRRVSTGPQKPTFGSSEKSHHQPLRAGHLKP